MPWAGKEVYMRSVMKLLILWSWGSWVFLVLLSWKYSWACQGGCTGLIFMGNKADVQPPQLIAPVFSAATQKRGQG